MKVIEPQNAILSNYEVLTHLVEMRARYDEQGKPPGMKSDKSSGAMKSGNLETIMKEMMDYLTAAPSPLKDYNEGSIRELIQALEPFQLEEAEFLMILNLRPSSVPELDVIVEEGEDRFGEEKMEEIVDIIGKVLGQASQPERTDGKDVEQSEEAQEGT